jgi:hypothetical protein
LYFGGYVTDLPIQTVKVKIILSSGMHLWSNFEKDV